MQIFITKNEKQTIRLGKKLARRFFAGLVVVLNGDLGAGKTAISKGFAKGLKIKQAVTSPTFTIMNEYTGGRLPMYHFDMYRIEESSEAYELGLTEFFVKDTGSNVARGVSVIEWAQNVADLIPQKNITITITKLDENTRKIEVEENL